MFNFSYVSWFFSLINLSLSKDGVEEEEDVLWALVFLTMMVKSRKDRQKETKDKTRKTKGRLQVRTKKEKEKKKKDIKLYDA